MIWALDSRLSAILAIPTDEIASVTAGELRGQWILRVRWLERTADFHYQGVFAQHFASVAESAIHKVMQPILRARPQKRAAAGA